ncbi:leucine rich adaptor protein 1 isoform X2 [Pelodiscus sinensis]|uniref:leucine rich adaptor protein 1 isoform X2 n=1 Tax=Pelodiscus sinensis TaxID=13735 RepID=UPI003F6CA10C
MLQQAWLRPSTGATRRFEERRRREQGVLCPDAAAPVSCLLGRLLLGGFRGVGVPPRFPLLCGWQAYLRAIDVKILQQLLVVNEGIEAVKWLLEEKGTLTSHCSSLASSQYSLAESQETSRRGSWTSLQDPSEKLDSISVGSYLDTLADETDVYCPGAAEPGLCSTPGRPGLPQDWARSDPDWGPPSKAEQDRCKVDPAWLRSDRSSARHALEHSTGDPAEQLAGPPPPTAPNGFLGRQMSASGPSREARSPPTAGEPSRGSAGLKAWRNGPVDLEPCKLNSKLHREYDAHWRWVQSQDDVTFL